MCAIYHVLCMSPKTVIASQVHVTASPALTLPPSWIPHSMSAAEKELLHYCVSLEIHEVAMRMVVNRNS